MNLPPNHIVTASEMADAIDVAATRLIEAEIVEPEGFHVLSQLSRRIRRSTNSEAWTIEIDRGEPLLFVKARDKRGRSVVPRIVAAGIRVDQERPDRPPFTALDIALEVHDEDAVPVARWHFDLANINDNGPQAGPLFHLQYGGHHHGHRELDHPLKVPRWCHPPMDVLLLCEAVAANFYGDAWSDIRDERNWCAAIALSQTLCYSAYLRRLADCLSVSSSTALNRMWAGNWI